MGDPENSVVAIFDKLVRDNYVLAGRLGLSAWESAQKKALRQLVETGVVSPEVAGRLRLPLAETYSTDGAEQIEDEGDEGLPARQEGRRPSEAESMREVKEEEVDGSAPDKKFHLEKGSLTAWRGDQSYELTEPQFRVVEAIWKASTHSIKETPKKPTLLEPEEIVRLLSELPEHFKALVACAVYAGLRRSELFHLQWVDIHWKVGELEVVSREEHPTKNNETRRIPINDALAEILRQHHSNRRNSLFVFCNREGQPYEDIREPLNDAAKRAGIEGGIKLHQLRHAFCSHALMQGIDAPTVQKWMGHKDLKTTLRYTHVSPDHEKVAIQRLRYQDGQTWSKNPMVRERKAS